MKIFLFLISCTLNFAWCSYGQKGRQLYESGVEHFKLAYHECFFDHVELKKAINDFEMSIIKGFKKYDLYENLALSYFHLNNDTKNAERIYTLGLSNFPGAVEFYFRRAQCREQLTLYKEALHDFDAVIRIDSLLRCEFINSAFYERGAMKFLLGDKTGAEHDRKQAQKFTDYELRTYEDYCQKFKQNFL